MDNRLRKPSPEAALPSVSAPSETAVSAPLPFVDCPCVGGDSDLILTTALPPHTRQCLPVDRFSVFMSPKKLAISELRTPNLENAVAKVRPDGLRGESRENNRRESVGCTCRPPSPRNIADAR
jgi:hypothetical protein